MTNWQKIFVRRLATVVAAAACALPAAAQDPAPTPPVQQPSQTTAQAPSGNTQAPPLSRPIPTRLVGLEPGKAVRWTLRDAITAALEKNVDIEIERENVRLAQFDLFASQGVYDPLTSSGISYNSLTQPNTSRFSGAAATQPNITSSTLNYNFGLQQFIERTGGSYSASFNNRRLTSNTSNFETQYSPQLTIGITQPLFRNFRTDLNRRQIQIFKKRLDLSDALFRQRAIEIIASVQQAYWDLAFAIRDEEIQRDAVKLAETQLQNNQRQVEVGTLAPIDVISAATVLETRRQQVFQAMNTVAQAENTLKSLTVESPTADLWTSQIVPVESFDAQPVTLPLNDAIRLAYDNRPEMRQFALQKEMNDIDLAYYRNQAKPQIDLVASYNLFGVGGTPATTLTCPPGTQPDPTAATFVCAPGNLAPITGTVPVFPGFVGGYGTSLRNLFSNDFRQWSVGVNFSFPLRNRTAKANIGRTLEAGRQLDLQTRRQLQLIEVEVRNSVQSVETAKYRIEASRAARQYAEQQLEGEQKKFAAGLSTTFFVLQRQTELSQARGTELRALADYNKAVAELQRTISTTLSSNSIEIKSEVPTANGGSSGKGSGNGNGKN